MSPLKRRLALLLAFASLVVCARVIASSSAELHRAREFEAEGAAHEAAIHYGRAIHMYLPGLPVPHMASERLAVLAEVARQRGDPYEARFCWEELRSAWLSVRSTWQPGQRWITQAEEALVPLMLADSRGNWPARTLPANEREDAVRAALEPPEDPSLVWVLVMGVGYILWLTAAALAIWKGLPEGEDEGPRWAVIARYAGLSCCGFALWLLGVGLA